MIMMKKLPVKIFKIYTEGRKYASRVENLNKVWISYRYWWLFVIQYWLSEYRQIYNPTRRWQYDLNLCSISNILCV